jgi:hypothetical protein
MGPGNANYRRATHELAQRGSAFQDRNTGRSSCFQFFVIRGHRCRMHERPCSNHMFRTVTGM